MTLNNVCQECGKTYAKSPTRCMCGWYFVRQDAPSNDTFLCQFFMNGKQCADAGSITFQPKGKDYYCGFHARILREESFKR
jgi:hypothetical protein